MRVSRLYTAMPLAAGKHIELDDDNGHYVRTVLRLKKDDKIILFNGKGGEYLCTVAEVSRKGVLIAVEQHHDRTVESPLQITLGLGIAAATAWIYRYKKPSNWASTTLRRY